MSIDLVRRIIADPHQFSRHDGQADGNIHAYRLDNAPVFQGTVEVYLEGVHLVEGTDYTLNPTVGVVAFVTPPAAGETFVVTYEHALLSDHDVQSFLDLNGGNVRRSAADALDTIASSEALIQKKIKLLDLETDGPAVAAQLRAHAKALRDQEDDYDQEGEGLFDYAEMALGPFNRGKLWWKEHGRHIDG